MHSALSASIPLIITDRIILMAEAAPTGPVATSTEAKPIARRAAAPASAAGPETSRGARWSSGRTGESTATSR